MLHHHFNQQVLKIQRQKKIREKVLRKAFSLISLIGVESKSQTGCLNELFAIHQLEVINDDYPEPSVAKGGGGESISLASNDDRSVELHFSSHLHYTNQT